MKTKFLIITCETNLDFSYYQKDYFIVGVERGCLDLIKKAINIDLAIADFDHVTEEELSTIKTNAKDFIWLDEEKDDLDGIFAVKKAYALGATEVVFVAKPTTRVDMNLSILELCYKYRVKFLNDQTVAFCLNAGETTLAFDKYHDYTYITFFPMHETNITITGLKYCVSDLKLLPSSTRAFSNCFVYNVDGKIKSSKPLLVIFNK